MPNYGNTILMRLLAQRQANQQDAAEREAESERAAFQIVDKERAREAKMAEAGGEVEGLGGAARPQADPQLQEIASITAERVQRAQQIQQQAAAAKAAARKSEVEMLVGGRQQVAQTQAAGQLARTQAEINAGKYDKTYQRLALAIRGRGATSKEAEIQLRRAEMLIKQRNQRIKETGTTQIEKDFRGGSVANLLPSDDPAVGAEIGNFDTAIEEAMDAAVKASQGRPRTSVVPPAVSTTTTTSTAGKPVVSLSALPSPVADDEDMERARRIAAGAQP